MQKRKAGRKKFHETRHPIYKGVRERNGKWVCELRNPKNKSRVWLGTFTKPDMAAIAYDVAALAFKGETTTSLNFPKAATSLPRLNSRTCSVRSIQFAAMQAAEKHFFCGDNFFQLQLPNEETTARNGDSESESLDCWVDPNGCMGMSSSSEDCGRYFWDEEEVFNMPGLMNSMAEGLMMTPPALQTGFNWVAGETTVDLTLWQN